MFHVGKYLERTLQYIFNQGISGVGFRPGPRALEYRGARRYRKMYVGGGAREAGRYPVPGTEAHARAIVSFVPGKAHHQGGKKFFKLYPDGIGNANV